MPGICSDNSIPTSSPYLNRFLQPDTIIPDPSNPQSWNRYSYVTNRPVNFNDPTGHRGCADEDASGNCIDQKTSLKNYIGSKYNVRIKGSWDENELLYLNDALGKATTLAGGKDNLSDIFSDGLANAGSSASILTFDNRAGHGNPKECGIGWACWDGEGSGSIILSDYIFTKDYQSEHSLPILKYPYHQLDIAIQFTMVHEIGHVFADARPKSVSSYTYIVEGNSLAFYSTQCGSTRSCTEENMASSFALYSVTGGSPNARFQYQLNFVDTIKNYWQATP